ncbi:MAG TPA: PQQ-binding-like beta-propeller repeat protein [Candidatus Polarisedimenticolia bacterium]|nr:PQQ-binding-like beta-propeller repeat protein [Candidatus Polarisedimenticolia bacterium]
MSLPLSPRGNRLPLFFVLAALAFVLGGAAWRPAAPAIGSLSATTLARSARLLIDGSGFGDVQGTGRVEIAGLTAFVTRWSDTHIAAYVPEAAPLGLGAVAVTIAGVRSNDLSLQVVARAPAGRVQWRFQADSDSILQRPAVGPDGTIVAIDNNGFVYALTPDGGLKWIRRALGASGAPAIGPDGSIFVASGNLIAGFAPDGTLRWQFIDPDSQGVIAGPGVGPDGNVYAVGDLFGLGAVALSPAGRLLWNHPGDPLFTEYGQIGTEIVFSPPPGAGASSQLYFGLDEYSVSASTVFALGADGRQMWARQAGISNDPFMQQQQQVAVGPSGTIYVTALNSASGWGLRALEPVTGAFLWGYNPWPANGMSPPDVGANGVVYLARSLAYLDAVLPDGKVKWTIGDGSIIDQPIVNKAGTLIAAGGRANFGEPGFVRGYAATNGAVRFTVPLASENGGTQILGARPRFSNDDRTVYVGTAILGGGTIDPYSYLYAVKATDLPAAAGEAAVTRAMTVRQGSGSSLVVDFGPACNATDHAIYWTAGSGPGPLAWTGSACGLGTGPTATFDPGTPAVGSAVYFVVVGRNAATEGSYGRSITGVERPKATGTSCDRPQIVATSCAP